MRRADVIVAAMGVAGFVKPEDIKEGSILVDVGVSRVLDEESGRYKVKGDVDKACYEKALAYTPNPGGVGPMTRAMLLQNVVEMAERQLVSFAIVHFGRVVTCDTPDFCAWLLVDFRLVCVCAHV